MKAPILFSSSLSVAFHLKIMTRKRRRNKNLSHSEFFNSKNGLLIGWCPRMVKEFSIFTIRRARKLKQQISTRFWIKNAKDVSIPKYYKTRLFRLSSQQHLSTSTETADQTWSWKARIRKETNSLNSSSFKTINFR